ncbi:MAG: right-handed parallel beta-helix repeat-containing protein [Candidatus Aenigmarchaeota archaeon]|nr:right-handed parallel beta-helix repeat-containing protein [Candidatus Aenigmarchaeota archaeon]
MASTVDQPPKATIVAPSTAEAGKPFTFIGIGTDDKDIFRIEAYYQGSWKAYTCDGTQASCSTSWSITESNAGTYTYYVYVYDNAGKMATTSKTITITAVTTTTTIPKGSFGDFCTSDSQCLTGKCAIVDKDGGNCVYTTTTTIAAADKAPTASIVSTSSAITGSPIMLIGIGTDDKDVYRIEAYYQGSWKTYNCEGVKTSCSNTWAITETSPGTYTYYVYAYDSIGQMATASKTVTVTGSTTIASPKGNLGDACYADAQCASGYCDLDKGECAFKPATTTTISRGVATTTTIAAGGEPRTLIEGALSAPTVTKTEGFSLNIQDYNAVKCFYTIVSSTKGTTALNKERACNALSTSREECPAGSKCTVIAKSRDGTGKESVPATMLVNVISSSVSTTTTLPPTTDTTKPTISITPSATEPKAGESVSIAVVSSDTGGINTIEFYNVDKASGWQSYSCGGSVSCGTSWTVTRDAPATSTYLAKATDKAGNSNTDYVTVKFAAATTGSTTTALSVGQLFEFEGMSIKITEIMSTGYTVDINGDSKTIPKDMPTEWKGLRILITDLGYTGRPTLQVSRLSTTTTMKTLTTTIIPAEPPKTQAHPANSPPRIKSIEIIPWPGKENENVYQIRVIATGDTGAYRSVSVYSGENIIKTILLSNGGNAEEGTLLIGEIVPGSLAPGTYVFEGSLRNEFASDNIRRAFVVSRTSIEPFKADPKDMPDMIISKAFSSFSTLLSASVNGNVQMATVSRYEDVYRFDLSRGTSQGDVITAEIDVDNKIEERDETNNVLEREIRDAFGIASMTVKPPVFKGSPYHAIIEVQGQEAGPVKAYVFIYHDPDIYSQSFDCPAILPCKIDVPFTLPEFMSKYDTIWINTGVSQPGKTARYLARHITVELPQGQNLEEVADSLGKNTFSVRNANGQYIMTIDGTDEIVPPAEGVKYGEKIIDDYGVIVINDFGFLASSPGAMYVLAFPSVPVKNTGIDLKISITPTAGPSGTQFSIVATAQPGLRTTAQIKRASLAADSETSGVITIPLYDDGSHGDRAPNDGIYGAKIDSANFAEGEYAIDLAFNDVIVADSASFAVTYTDACIPVDNRGDSDDNIDIVVMSNNYAPEETYKFVDVVLPTHINYLLSKEPYSTYRDKFNVWYAPADVRKDCDITQNGWQCLEYFKSLSAEKCPFRDVTIVLDNNGLGYAAGYSGGIKFGTQITRYSSTADTKGATLHEFGHTFADLADEYFAAPPRMSAVAAPNCDVAGCPKWCGAPAFGAGPECFKITDKSSCEDKKYSYGRDTYSCIWLPDGNGGKGACEFPYVANVNFATSCQAGTACYYGCGGYGGFRSSKTSVMGSGNIAEYNDLSKRHIVNVINCCYARPGSAYDINTCSAWNAQNNNKFLSCIINAPTHLPTQPIYEEGCQEVAGLTIIDGNVKLCDKVYRATAQSIPGIIINSDDTVLDCNGAALEGNYQGYGIRINANNVEVKNCKVSKYFIGVFAEKSSNVKITDSDISNNYRVEDHDVFLDIHKKEPWGGGIFFSDVKGGAIENSILRNQQDGISFLNVNDVRVSKNEADHNTGYGIKLYGSNNNEIDRNDFSYANRACSKDAPSDLCRAAGIDSTTYGCGCDSAAVLLVASSSNNRITSNDMSYGGDGFFLNGRRGDSKDNYVAFNDATGSPHNAFEAVFASGNKFYNNIASDSNYGFWLSYTINTEVIGNAISGNRNDGIAAERPSTMSVEKNTITNNNRNGINFWERMAERDYETSESTGNHIIDNVLEENANTDVFTEDTKDTVIQNNVIRTKRTGVNIAGKSSSIYIMENDIYCNGCMYAVSTDPASQDVLATNNWWGTTDAAKISSIINGNIPYSPASPAPMKVA